MDLVIERVQRVISESVEEAHRDPCKMRALARKAVKMAAGLPVSSRAANDLRAEAWANLANAFRVCNDFADAGPAFEWAWHFHAAGAGGATITARLCELQGSLYESLRRPAEALACLNRALEHREELGDLEGIGRCLVQQANVIGHAGDPVEAVRLLMRAMSFVSASKNPRLAYALAHNLCWFLVDAGHPETAMTLLLERRLREAEEGCPLLANGDETMEARSRWLEARIAAGLGDFEAAAHEMEEVRQFFEARGLPYEVALLSVELALLQRPADAIQTVCGLRGIFRDLGLGRESVAVQLVETALAAGEITEVLPYVLRALRTSPPATGRRKVASRRPVHA
ncbi:MAG TPA: hypothetical protein VLT87_11105 [Thermoanaerobaculia bacterium]|nr:hypothetical protein [Thermoanaerobaculia bacterium]